MEDRDELSEKHTERRRFTDFDCPDCSANNPMDDSFGIGDEVRCHYCGAEFEARVGSTGRLRLRPT